ncbi:hypothetical protein BZA77DRAFT_128037 [Pyronema omphalodes]|nr:hypothetical protein BZA77DRAFT_128037 [Pyronema omphalodes]
MDENIDLETKEIRRRWSEYTIKSSLHDPRKYDLETITDMLSCHRYLCDYSNENTKVDYLLIQADQGPRHSTLDTHQLTEVIQHVSTSKLLRHFFYFIDPAYSFGSLKISIQDMVKLLSGHAVFLGFLDVLKLYGEKIDEFNENLVVYRQKITPQTTSIPQQQLNTFEMCYNWKYVDIRTCNATGKPKWTTRKMGIYSKYHYSNKTTTWIMLQASQAYRRHLNTFFPQILEMNQYQDVHALELHLMMMNTASQNWIPYINELEEKVMRLDTVVFQWRPKPGNPVATMDLESQLELEDTQRIENIKVQLISAAHAMDINCSNISSIRRGLEALQREEKFRQESSPYATEREHYLFDQQLGELLVQTTEHRRRVKSLILKTESLFSVVKTIVPYVFARRENVLMLELSEKATQYAQSMKVITVVCMLYLPPSLIAVRANLSISL